MKGLGLEHDWSEATTMMKEELSVDGEARSAEDGVIATSLRAIKGREADSARALFKAFRLVPEDVKIPLEALAWVYEASNEAGGSSGGIPTLLQLRRWTKLLIERCLVLGPIDQPSLHDIVKDCECWPPRGTIPAPLSHSLNGVPVHHVCHAALKMLQTRPRPRHRKLPKLPIVA